MRKAVQAVRTPAEKYKLIGNNCQNWAESVRNKLAIAEAIKVIIFNAAYFYPHRIGQNVALA